MSNAGTEASTAVRRDWPFQSKVLKCFLAAFEEAQFGFLQPSPFSSRIDETVFSEPDIVNQPEPHSLSFPVLMTDIEKGLIRIPQFQRDFVWSKEKSAELLDSVLKGYPIGTFILWKTKVELRTVRNIGGVALPDTPEGDYVQHVLDGQQRLTSLYSSVRGLRVPRDGKMEDFASIFVNLEASEEDSLVITDTVGCDPAVLIRIVDLHDAGYATMAKYPSHLAHRLDDLRMRLKTYAFSVILVKDAPLEVATEIFTRINVTGKHCPCSRLWLPRPSTLPATSIWL